jgi:GxxExxY protein
VRLRKTYVSDSISYGQVLLGLKAGSTITDEHRAQVQNYLPVTGLKVGSIVNFGHFPKTQHERFVL